MWAKKRAFARQRNERQRNGRRYIANPIQRKNPLQAGVSRIHGVLGLGYEIPITLNRNPNSALTKNERTPHPGGIAALAWG